ncbi:hypothetical protein DACRYDRAFT_24668 [Dacryopinax primogenitus]|uniref:Uncharacterized protein n=1 Tax=Dacryopinax primogenitus (strain DJM 731) TaxID=1858805 RepID=M5G339_DACPD|nr:uncharacterized protein DACRYDRAFT_24668 [Dacryopinax primogenitus]EJT98167.1 hypothetical protein DACRYDRAFT_24668 [Dacryopinax primogenitus]
MPQRNSTVQACSTSPGDRVAPFAPGRGRKPLAPRGLPLAGCIEASPASRSNLQFSYTGINSECSLLKRVTLTRILRSSTKRAQPAMSWSSHP